ncbi:MAG: hypothetical protein BGO21_23865 [Dyadobacter sp. 50-39]|uniref:hypothetical protein n=1 Tax=Dyadobacter sp. 50-39 TaxID=1895756 RepID=UPI0009626F2B|nr:hypothetical protein [Dyadobacter sp. 50-39]OJV18572.1 MAG: hypothetical protein BGO21_23865 [Dyadobacter sp. 50-39]
MKRIAYSIFFLLFVALSAFECDNGKDCCAMPPCSEIASLSGTWRLDYFQNTATGAIDTDPEISGKSVVFTFSDDQKKGTISGNTFVNTVSGAYTLGGNCTFKITSFGGSKVGEPEWSRKAWLPSDSTGGKGSYHIQSNKLILKFDQNPEQLVFKKDK